MEVTAKAKYVRMSPRKVRIVADLIRGLSLAKAFDQLDNTGKWAVKPIKKVLLAASASAEHDFELSKDNLYIKKIFIDEGPTLRRWKPRARGRATPIRKRTSHISIILDELVASGKTKAKDKKVAAPMKLDSKPKQDDGVKIKKTKDAGSKDKSKTKTQEKSIIDSRMEGKGKHTKIEGQKGIANKIFRRKSG